MLGDQTSTSAQSIRGDESAGGNYPEGRLGLGIVAFSWLLAGILVGAFIAWRTVSMNDSIRLGRDAVVLTAWMAFGYGVVLMVSGVCLHIVRRMFVRNGKSSFSASVAAQLCAGVLFFFCLSFIY